MLVVQEVVAAAMVLMETKSPVVLQYNLQLMVVMQVVVLVLLVVMVKQITRPEVLVVVPVALVMPTSTQLVA